MIVNPGKFQALIINRLVEFENTYNISIDNKQISSTSSVALLGLQIDN